MCFPFTKIEGKPTDQSRRNSAADTVTGRADRKQGRVTDAEGERSVLARALRRANRQRGKASGQWQFGHRKSWRTNQVQREA